MKTHHALLFLASFLLLLQPACRPSTSSTLGASAPSDTIRKLFSLIEKGQVQEATSLCTERFQNAQGNKGLVKSTFAALTPKIKSSGGVAVEILKETIDGEVATVTFNLRYGNGEVEPCKYRLLKEHGQWKHDGNAD